MAIKDNGLGESLGASAISKEGRCGFPFRLISGGGLMVTGTWEEGTLSPWQARL